MASKVITFSITEHDKANLARIERIKQYAMSRGMTMSWVILKALKDFEATNIKGV